MREFAEDEIVIPHGRWQGRRFSCHRQPYSRLWFEAVDSHQWNRHVATGPTQSGKSLTCFVIPMMYHIFEIQETVICGLPSMDMAKDKWEQDIRPVIEHSRYRELLPTKGKGSRGGTFESITFKNGVTLKFMSGGGGDKKRSAFTARVLIVTETDGMDEAGKVSREADKITQLEARTLSYGDQKLVYLECTVSIEEGRTWREFNAGTQSRIITKCCHCFAWVSPERDHLTGYQDAESEFEAADKAAFYCPECGGLWSEDERREANENARLIHRGQDVAADEQIVGPEPQTKTLGFRWNAYNNMFLSAGFVAAREWMAARDPDEENAEKEMQQFYWAVPHEPSITDTTPLEAYQIVKRTTAEHRGQVPTDTEWLTIGIDLGKWRTHWAAIAWTTQPRCHVVDYGVIEVDSEHLGVERATMATLRDFRDRVASGWLRPNDTPLTPDAVWIDSGYMTDVVYEFCKESGDLFRPTKGHGTGQQNVRYSRPKTKGALIRQIGEGYHISRLRKQRINLVEIDADQWKTWVHQRLSCPVIEPGAMTLYAGGDHLAFAKHLTAERKIEEFIVGRGTVVKWEAIRKQNHWLDAVSLACVAGHFCGVRLIDDAPGEGQGEAVLKATAEVNGWFSQQQRRPR